MSAYIQDQLVNLPPYLFLVAGLERAFTVFVHIALSLVVLLAVVKGKAVYLLFAVLLHTAVNFPAVIIPGLGYSILYAELYLLVLAVLSWMFIFRSRGSFPNLPDLEDKLQWITTCGGRALTLASRFLLQKCRLRERTLNRHYHVYYFIYIASVSL